MLAADRSISKYLPMVDSESYIVALLVAGMIQHLHCTYRSNVFYCSLKHTVAWHICNLKTWSLNQRKTWVTRFFETLIFKLIHLPGYSAQKLILNILFSIQPRYNQKKLIGRGMYNPSHHDPFYWFFTLYDVILLSLSYFSIKPSSACLNFGFLILPFVILIHL